MTLVRIHPDARREIRDSASWYAQRSKRAARRFLDAVEDGVSRIERLPDVFPLLPAPGRDLVLRKALLRRFPYVIVCVRTKTLLGVIAIAHMKRRPFYWLERVVDIETEP